MNKRAIVDGNKVVQFKPGPEMSVGNSSGARLSYLAEKGRMDEVKPLLRTGVNIESRDRAKQTPLIWAVKGKQYEMTKFLLERGAAIEFQGEKTDEPTNTVWKRTALIWAAYLQEYAIASILVKKGARTEIKDGFEKTAKVPNEPFDKHRFRLQVEKFH